MYPNDDSLQATAKKTHNTQHYNVPKSFGGLDESVR